MSTRSVLVSLLVVILLQVGLGEWVNPFPRIPRLASKKYSWELDADAMRRQANFPIASAKLIEKAKVFIDSDLGTADPDLLSEDFVFQFPIIGPLTKSQYIKAFKSFKLPSLFPDANTGACDFRIDPFEPNRVWFTAYFQGTNNVDSAITKATNKTLRTPPQANAVIFNEKGKVIKYIGGYVMDKEWGNTGGLGGVFGLFYGLGKPLPFPEAKPYKPSLQFRLFSFIGNIASKFQRQD